MIILTRLNGGEFALNPDLIERADSTPDTVLTLTDGTKYVVSESVVQVLALVRDFRASVIARSHVLEVSDLSLSDEPNHYEITNHHVGGQGDEGDNVRVLRPLRGQ